MSISPTTPEESNNESVERVAFHVRRWALSHSRTMSAPSVSCGKLPLPHEGRVFSDNSAALEGVTGTVTLFIILVIVYAVMDSSSLLLVCLLLTAFLWTLVGQLIIVIDVSERHITAYQTHLCGAVRRRMQFVPLAYEVELRLEPMMGTQGFVLCDKRLDLMVPSCSKNRRRKLADEVNSYIKTVAPSPTERYEVTPGVSTLVAPAIVTPGPGDPAATRVPGAQLMSGAEPAGGHAQRPMPFVPAVDTF